MLAAFGAGITVQRQQSDDGIWGRRVEITGPAVLTATEIIVPRDFSSAAFPLVAATLVPGSDIILPGVGLNPLRSGLLDILGDMGASVEVRNAREEAGEPVGDLHIRSADLRAVTPDPALAPRLIDEYPLLFVAAACATGTSVFTGLGELRVKESDRIAAMAKGLAANGVRVEETPDGLVVEGCAGPPPGGGSVVTESDHRIAMAFLVLGAVAEQPVTIDDGGMIDTSFPGFIQLMNALGCRMSESQ
jgi:3-phosphoshikimate 1-carboxyvinyltransferase